MSSQIKPARSALLKWNNVHKHRTHILYTKNICARELENRNADAMSGPAHTRSSRFMKYNIFNARARRTLLLIASSGTGLFECVHDYERAQRGNLL